ncbi:hypothetical protein [Streptomyces sp. 7N604]|uniref:hypothetical protein n=1 Tax=Streptomyces sp. 7N604 TaxID=3457415 RepID=UPI003FD08488
MSNRPVPHTPAEGVITRARIAADNARRAGWRRWATAAASVGIALAALLSAVTPAQATVANPSVAAAAPTADYPPPACTLTLSSTVVRAGGSLTVSGRCFRPFSLVSVRLDATLLTFAVANGSGVATATVTIPRSTSTGLHQISMSGVNANGAPLTESASILVTPPASAALASEGPRASVPLPTAGAPAPVPPLMDLSALAPWRWPATRD